MHWRDLISLHAIAAAVGLIIYVLASHSMRQRRHPSAAIAWVITLALLPYVGLPLYLLFGTRKLVRPKRRAPHYIAVPGSEPDIWPQRLAAAMSLAPAASFDDLRIHEDGREALESLHAMIDSASRTLDICTYVLGNDRVGDGLCDKLEARARAGVKVRILVDSLGNFADGRHDFGALRNAGIDVVSFVPPLHSPRRGRTNLRDHRKMVIVDGVWLWCGGRNLAAEYFEGAPCVDPWLDLSFDLKGALAARAQDCFDNDWAFATDKEPPRTRRTDESAHKPLGQLFPSGPDQTDDTVYSLLVTAFFRARSRIVAVTPYFVPDSTLVMALALAARRNVQVDLLLPAKSNHRMADIARHRALRELAEAGARIRLVPTMIHAKAVVIDDSLALAGSANLDARSLFLNFELMVAFYGRAEVRRIAEWIDRRATGARPYVARPPGLLRDVSEGLLLWLAFQL